MLTTGHYIWRDGRRVFILWRGPEGGARGCVLVVPPFGEEMNKSRRMLTLLAARLAPAGVSVVIPDLLGTGDSDGELSDATLQSWYEDVAAVSAWCAREKSVVTAVLGIRLGCALALSALALGHLPPVATTLLWQPVLDGRRHLTQFLRLRAVGSLGQDRERESVGVLRGRLSAGETLDVVGYSLTPRLASDIDGLCPPTAYDGRCGAIHWMEVTSDPKRELPVASQGFVSLLESTGGRVTVDVVDGEPFWSAVEIVVSTGMLDVSCSALRAAHS